jgi:hypothetical protein
VITPDSKSGRRGSIPRQPATRTVVRAARTRSSKPVRRVRLSHGAQKKGGLASRWHFRSSKESGRFDLRMEIRILPGASRSTSQRTPRPRACPPNTYATRPRRLDGSRTSKAVDEGSNSDADALPTPTESGLALRTPAPEVRLLSWARHRRRQRAPASHKRGVVGAAPTAGTRASIPLVRISGCLPEWAGSILVEGATPGWPNGRGDAFRPHSVPVRI